MRQDRKRIFNNFYSDVTNDVEKFEIDTPISIDRLSTTENSSIYGRMENLLNDDRLNQIVHKQDVDSFLSYLQEKKLLPELRFATNNFNQNPSVQQICNSTWCTTTHVVAYAEGVAVVLALVAATSVTLAAAVKVVDDKDVVGLSVEMASVLGNENFANKVKEKLDMLVQQQVEAVSNV